MTLWFSSSTGVSTTAAAGAAGTTSTTEAAGASKLIKSRYALFPQFAVVPLCPQALLIKYE